MGLEIVVFFSATLFIEFLMTFPAILAWMHSTNESIKDVDNEGEDEVRYEPAGTNSQRIIR
jgi:hypothetical protein